MKSRVAFSAVVAMTALLATGSCGDVPTLENGIAYVSPVLLPSPAVASLDQLRDSLGRPAPLRVIAYDRDGAEVPGVAATFLPTSLPSLITIDANGFVTAADTVGTVQIVARIGDRLQTTVASLLIVPQPTSFAGASRADTVSLPALDTLTVTVRGIRRGAQTAIPGIIVRFRVDSVAGPSPASASAVLAADGGVVARPDSTASVDTTNSSGVASRTLVVSGSGVDRVYVSARARNLRGEPIPGSPAAFVLQVKR